MEFWGAFLAVIVGIGLIALVVTSKLRVFSRRVFGSPNLLKVLENTESIEDQSPRSLNGCDSLLLPQILKDFPDFDVNLAKTYARDQLRSTYGAKEGFTVYNIVIYKYLRSSAQKTIVFQAAVSWKENGQVKQRRFDLDYAYILSASDTIASNCPNCGGALGYGVSVCPYCDSRVVNPLGSSWKFTQIRES